jgi:hypothetical protein
MSDAKRSIMPFIRPAPLPPTSYGYRPPRAATASGWTCTNRNGCGQSDNRRVRRWPARCPSCGWPADPLFDPPWEHDALGVDLKWQIEHDTNEYDLQIARERLIAWLLNDARLRGDAAGVAAARTALHRYVAQQVKEGNWWNPSFTLAQAVHEGIDAGDFDGTAQDLCFWLGISTGENAAKENDIRANARSAISSGAAFLGAPAGVASRHAPEIRAGCLRIAEGAFPELNRELQAAIMQMARQQRG